MAKKYKCCFCDETLTEDFGATNENNGKFMCMGCILELYDALQECVADAKINYSIKVEGE